MKKILQLALCVILVGYGFAYAQENPAYISQVVQVIDGDTLLLVSGETVELIGIDCPELDTEEGRKAAEFVKGLIREASIVRLEFDVQEKDENGNLLAYVYQRLRIFGGSGCQDTCPETMKRLGEWACQDRCAEPMNYGDSIKREGGKNVIYSFLNLRLIGAGYAKPQSSPPNTKYDHLFENDYRGGQ